MLVQRTKLVQRRLKSKQTDTAIPFIDNKKLRNFVLHPTSQNPSSKQQHFKCKRTPLTTNLNMAEFQNNKGICSHWFTLQYLPTWSEYKRITNSKPWQKAADCCPPLPAVQSRLHPSSPICSTTAVKTELTELHTVGGPVIPMLDSQSVCQRLPASDSVCQHSANPMFGKSFFFFFCINKPLLEGPVSNLG